MAWGLVISEMATSAAAGPFRPLIAKMTAPRADSR